MTTIGERIKKLRKDAGLSQVKFSAALGLTQSFLSGLEKGRYQPTVALLIRVANIYKPDAHWLLTGESSASEAPEVGAEGGPLFDKISESILLVLRQMPEEKKRKVLEYAEEQKLLSELLLLK